MISEKTVFVLGAGASYSYGFPTGGELKDIITTSLLNAAGSIESIENLGFSRTVIQQFRDHLMLSGRMSVDLFLANRPEYIEVGKAAIALALLPCEQTYHLFDYWPMTRLKVISDESAWSKRISQIKGNWYEYVFNAMTEDIPFEEVNKNKLSVITFNYDRSFEHYLYTALKNTYGKTIAEVTKAMSDIEIIHVHGCLGKLPWQVDNSTQDKIHIDYDANLNNENVRIAAKAIKILHEGESGNHEFVQARKLLQDAKRVYFIGFGFHPTNLDRLGMNKLSPSSKKVSGTVMGLGATEKKRLTLYGFVRDAFYNDLFYDQDVYSFLHDHVVL